MEEIIGYNIGMLPIDGLQKISDLLEYEGPILSHFKDSKGNNYLYYWVDFTEEVNRWLIWRISDEQLYNYLKGAKSLKDLIESPNKEYIYSVEIDVNLNYNNVQAINIDNLPSSYLPEEETHYKLDIPAIYNNLLNSFEENYYLAILREKALYFTLEPSNSEFSTTVSAIDAGDFLKKISSSFLSFVEEDFFNTFKNQITDFSRLKKIIGEFKHLLSPRVVELEYGSFKVGISADTGKSIESDKYREWQIDILHKYKAEVVDIDYSSDDILRHIADKYSEESRKKIFQPIVSLLSDDDYKVEVTNYRKSFKRKFNKIPKSKEEIIIPKRFIEDVPEKKKLYNVVIEMTEGQDISKLSKKSLQDGLLFSQELNVVELELNEFVYENTRFVFSTPLKFLYRIEGAIYIVENAEFKISVGAVNKEEALLMFQQEFAQKYFNSLNRENEELINKFNSILAKVEIVERN